MPLEPQGFASPHAELAAVALIGETPRFAPMQIGWSKVLQRETPFVEHSPPDLNLLNSTFLI